VIQPPLHDPNDAQRTLGAVLANAIDVLRDIPALEPEWPEDGSKLERFVDKLTAETALLILLARRVEALEASVRNLVDDLADRLGPHARSDRNAVMLLRYPHAASTLGFAHIALSHAGYGDSRFDALVRGCFESDQMTSIERVPFRFGELLWQCRLLGVEGIRGQDAVDRLSILATSPNPCFGLREQCYQVTHALMYATDFGRISESVAGRAGLSRTIDAFLAWRSAKEDLDLVGELLVAVECLNEPWSPAACIAATQLWQTWCSFGYVPDLYYDAHEHERLTGTAARAYEVRRTYHSTYVLGLLCSLIAARGGARRACTGGGSGEEIGKLADRCEQAVASSRAEVAVQAPDEERSASATRPSSLDHALEALPPGVIEAVDAAPVCARCGTTFVLDCALMLAVKSYDLVGAARLLADVVEHGAAPSAAATASIEFLLHQRLREGSVLLDQLLATTLAVCAGYLTTENRTVTGFDLPLALRARRVAL
jgi:hypothetical protein